MNVDKPELERGGLDVGAQPRNPPLLAWLLPAVGILSFVLGLLLSGIPRYRGAYNAGLQAGRTLAYVADQRAYQECDPDGSAQVKGRVMAFAVFADMTWPGSSGSLRGDHGTCILTVEVFPDTMIRSMYPGLVDVKSSDYMQPGYEYSVEPDGIWHRPLR
jgi:hypothetical protein